MTFLRSYRQSAKAQIWSWGLSLQSLCSSHHIRSGRCTALEHPSSNPPLGTGSINRSQDLWTQRWPWNPSCTAPDSHTYQSVGAEMSYCTNKYILPKIETLPKSNLLTSKKSPNLSSSLLCLGRKRLVDWELWKHSCPKLCWDFGGHQLDSSFSTQAGQD